MLLLSVLSGELILGLLMLYARDIGLFKINFFGGAAGLPVHKSKNTLNCSNISM